MKSFLLLLFFVIVFDLGCAGSQRSRAPEETKQQIAELQTELQSLPNDARLWRDLGVAYFEDRQYQTARRTLLQAFKRDTRDAKTLFYLGLVLEFEQRTKLAMAVYQTYRSAPRFSSYRKLMRARYEHLSRQSLQADMRALLQQEREFSADSVSTNAVAVFPLLYQGEDEEMAALSKGLAEMMITDLSQVKQLEVVDRVRVQALFDEMALGQSGLVDEATAAKFGGLIRAGKIVRGVYEVRDKDQLNIEVAFWDVEKQNFPAATTHAEALKNLFQLEKSIVFGVIEDMGIALTPAEQEKIQTVPTKNLRAFLYYCTGLAKEDAGQFAEASKFYLKAARLDPDFASAADKAEIAADINKVNGGPEEVLSAALTLEDPADENGLTLEENTLTEERLDILEQNIDANFEPGQDSRDATDAGFNIPLRRPPPPPP
jgi:TolB-like protein